VGLGGAGHQEGAAQVHVHHRVPVVGTHLEEKVVADDARVVDQDRDRSELGGGPLDGVTGGGLVGHVGSHRDGPTTGLQDGVGSAGAACDVQVDDGDGDPLAGQPASGRGADSSGGSGDHGNSRRRHDRTLLTRGPD
jgi:hypothetical protein